MFNLAYISRQNDLMRQRLVEKANAQLSGITDVLRDLLKPSKIIVFGSINEKEKFNRYSDIDIAVSDIDEDEYLMAYGEILSRSLFPIDLIIIEKVSPHFKEKILKTGRVVYERD